MVLQYCRPAIQEGNEVRKAINAFHAQFGKTQTAMRVQLVLLNGDENVVERKLRNSITLVSNTVKRVKAK
jgi:TRAP-type mannitol/chloroaromatic compound transport system permease small subunit